ncbi:MAG: phosphoribosylanthranilate isomerase [Ktedonobacteraceae bacterium]
MLVGESLVVSNDVPAQIHMLLQGANASTQVKICGLRNPEHIQTALAAGADMLGFVFYEPSHRYIQPQHVREALAVALSTSKEQVLPDIVGVFVNKEVNFINDVVEEAGLHYVQLHGTEPPEFFQHITRPVLKAIPLKNAADLAQVALYKDAAWRLLLDTPTPEWGGTGMIHDWDLASTIAQETHILLAGGLTSENVAQALQQVQPWGVDVSSGVETNKQKDNRKIRAFLENVRTTMEKKEEHANTR